MGRLLQGGRGIYEHESRANRGDTHTHTIETRLQRATDAWGALWDGGDAYEPGLAEPLEPIMARAIRTVMRRQGTCKSRGAGGSLARLPMPSPVATIPGSKAETEAQLRPIGLLPYIYRVWMAIRKQQSRDCKPTYAFMEGRTSVQHRWPTAPERRLSCNTTRAEAPCSRIVGLQQVL